MSISVVALNLGHSTLGIGRCLAGTNVRVEVFASNRWGIGAGSRLLRVIRAPDCTEQDGALLRDRLVSHAAGLRWRPHLFPTRDLDVVFIDRHRKALEPHYTIHQPSGDRLDQVINKARLTALAEAAGLAVPRTLAFSAQEPVPPRLPAGLRYPVIVKPIYAHDLVRLDVAASRAARKASIAGTEQEACAALAHLLQAGADAYLQEFVAGSADRLIICGGYLSQDGSTCAAYTARKVFQYPPAAGIGFVVETIDQPEVRRQTVSFLEQIGFCGFFEAEFKEDETGVPHLIEVNPRHWDQHALGRHRGVNVTRLAVGSEEDDGAKGRSAQTGGIRTGLWCDDAMLMRLVLSFDGQVPEVMARLWKARRSVVLAPSVFSLSDPVPGLLSAVFVLKALAISGFLRLTNKLQAGGRAQRSRDAG